MAALAIAVQPLQDLGRQTEGPPICPCGEAAAWPVQGMLRHFWHEFEYAIVNKRFLVDDERDGKVVRSSLEVAA